MLTSMTPEDPRYTKAMQAALDFTRQRVTDFIAEARERKCLFYKAGENIRTHVVKLDFTDAGSVKYSRTIDCRRFFEDEGLYLELHEASQLRAEADQLFIAPQAGLRNIE